MYSQVSFLPLSPTLIEIRSHANTAAGKINCDEITLRRPSGKRETPLDVVGMRVLFAVHCDARRVHGQIL